MDRLKMTTILIDEKMGDGHLRLFGYVQRRN